MKVPDRLLRFGAAALVLLACAGGYARSAASSTPAAPSSEPLAQAPGGQVGLPAAQATPPKFRLDAGAVFYTLKPDVAEKFEALIVRLAQAKPPQTEKAASPRKPAERWRVFRILEPLASGSIVYCSFVDSPEADVEYSIARIFRERLPAEPPETFTSLVDRLAGTVVMANYKLISDFASKDGNTGATHKSPGPPAASPAEAARQVGGGCPAPAASDSATPAPLTGAPAAAADPMARCFSGAAGMLFYYVKGDRTQDFELLVGRVKSALQTSAQPERRAQASGWRVFRQSEPRGTHGVVVYLSLLDPVTQHASYAISQILTEAYPAEAQQLLSTYNSSNADGMSLANLRLVGELR